jgi:diguanylate cyclase (GGDEF)-like protein
LNVEALVGYPLLSAAAIHLAFALLILWRGRKSKVHTLVAWTAVVCCLYCLAGGLTYVRASLGLSYGFFYRTIWIGGLALAVGSQAIAVLVGTYAGVRRAIILASYVFWAAVFAACLATDLIETGSVQLVPFIDRAGALAQPFRLLAALQGLWIVALAVGHRKRAIGYRREQVNYFIAGAISFALGGVIAGVLPVLKIWALDPGLVSYLTLPWVAATYYAISRYRLRDFQVTLSKAIAATSVVLVLGAAHIALFFLLRRLVGTVLGIVLATLLTAVVLFAGPVLPAMRALSDRLTKERTARRNECLGESSPALGSLLSLEDLIRKSIDLVRRGLGVEDAGLLLPDEEGIFQLRVAEGEMNKVRTGLPATSLLAQFLASGQAVAVREEMEGMLSPQDFQPLAVDFDGLAAEAAVAMTFKDALRGILLLGRKADRRALYPGDVDFLGAVANGTAAAIDNARLFEEATKDGLTKMYHRKYFVSRLRVEIARAKRHRRRLALLFIDIDHFKKINDEHGHLAGDQILREVAALILKHCREEDLICRYGGDEFVVLLMDIRQGDGEQAAERLRRIVGQAEASRAFSLTVSIGVQEYSGIDTAMTDDSLLREADGALYEAKRQGRNRVVLAAVPA